MLSRVRSWSRLCVLGAILWASIAKSWLFAPEEATGESAESSQVMRPGHLWRDTWTSLSGPLSRGGEARGGDGRFFSRNSSSVPVQFGLVDRVPPPRNFTGEF